MWGGHPARPAYASLFVEQFSKGHGGMATKLRHSPCSDWLRASRLLTDPRRLRLQWLDERQSLSELVKSLEALNEATQDFGFILVPFGHGE